MPKSVSYNDFNLQEKILLSQKRKDLIAYSNNKRTTYDSSSTRLLIVGTLTPPNADYFYCSKFNRIYGYIDEATKNKESFKSLKVLKKELNESLSKKTKQILIKEIRDVLSKYGIAFLDVMEKAIRKKVSPYDADISIYVLAENDFKMAKSKQSLTIIANSRLASDCLKKMGIVDHVFLSQRFGKKEEWVSTIDEALFK